MPINPLQNPVTADVLTSGDSTLAYNLFPQATQQTQDTNLNNLFTRASQGQSVFPTYAARVQAEGLADLESRNNFSNTPLLTSGASNDSIVAQQLARARQVTGRSSVNPLSFITNDPAAYQKYSDDSLLSRMGGNGVTPSLPSGVSASPVTPQSLLSDSNFSAILQKDPQQAQNLFRAFTGSDLGSAIKEIQDTHKKQVDEGTSNLQKLISAGLFKEDEHGSPLVGRQNPLTGQVEWSSIDNKDPNHALPYATANQLLDPTVRANVGLPDSPQVKMQRMYLTYRNKGASPQQALALVAQHAQNGGNATTAMMLNQQQPQVRPQTAPQGINAPVKPLDPQQQVQQDQQSLNSLGNSLSERLNDGADTAMYTMMGMGQTAENAVSNFMNNASRAGNLLSRLTTPNAPLDAMEQIPPSNSIFIPPTKQQSATLARRSAGGYGRNQVQFANNK